jgi:hypothetical protein
MSGQKTVTSTHTEQPDLIDRIFSSYTSNLIPWLSDLSGTLKITFPSLPFYPYRWHYDHEQYTMWGGSSVSKKLWEYKIQNGNYIKITDIHFDVTHTAIDGACVDSRDGTLWVNNDPDPYAPSIYHCARKPNINGKVIIINNFVMTGISNHPKDLCFDRSDNTLWVIDDIAKKIYHISTLTGLEIAGTLDLQALGFNPGTNAYCVEYDKTNDNLWFGVKTVGLYHITKAGIQIAFVPLAFNPSGPSGFTLCPSIRVY